MTAVVSLSLYGLIVAGLLYGNHRMCRGRDVVERIPVYPPPIAATREPLDATWADVSDVIDEDAAMNREFVSLISSTWHWDEEEAA